MPRLAISLHPDQVSQKKKKSYYTFYWAVQQLGIPKLVIQHPSDRVKFEHWNWKAVYLLLQVFTKYLIEFF